MTDTAQAECFIPDKEVREICGGISEMTLWRWDRDPDLNFPPPVRINRRKYRDKAAVLAFWRNRLPEAGAA